MQQYGTIYKVTNKVNNKIYIGQTTTSLEKRWKMHKTESRSLRKKSALHYAMNKYGIDSFKIESICTCLDKEELNLKEIYFIDTLNALVPSGYNLKLGGDAGKWSKVATENFSAIKKELHKNNPELNKKLNANFNEWFNSLSPEEQQKQLELQTKSSREYWNDPENKFKKSDEEHARWQGLTEEEKKQRTQGFREYWTEDRLSAHSEKMKSMELWKKSGCLEKAQEATRKGVKVIEISTQKETIYLSRAKCVKALRMTAGTLIDILNGKRSNEYKGFRFFPI